MPIVLSPIIAGLFAAMGAVALARLLKREWRRINDELERMARAADVERAALPTLRPDPVSGVYRPE